MQGAWVQSLVEELRSPQAMWQKKKKGQTGAQNYSGKELGQVSRNEA